MKIPFKKPDPDSFEGKVLLLIVDKLVIGIVIALAFVGYDIWKTFDERDYREEIELPLKRAEYVKELVPMVLDNDRDVLIRGQALSALVETHSISADSAVTLAQSLLLADLLGAGRYFISRVNPVNEEVRTYTFLPGTQDHVLLTTLLDVMPEGLPLLLRVYSNTHNQYRRIRDSNSSSEERRTLLRILNDTMGFWIRLFKEIVVQLDDEKLAILNSDTFLEDHLQTIDAIVPQLSTVTAKEWLERDNKALNILGAIKILGSSGETGETSTSMGKATRILKFLIFPEPTNDRLALSSEVIKLLHRRGVVSTDLGAKGLEIVLMARQREAGKMHVGEELNATDRHFYSMANYLVWLGKFPQVSKVLKDTIHMELTTFLDEVKKATESELDYGKSYLIEQTLVQFLLLSNSTANQLPSDEAHALLCDLFSIGKEKLRKTGLRSYAESYKATKSCIR